MYSTHKPDQKLLIVVLGYIVRGPLGGMAWHHLQYLTGLSDLGHDVYFLEDSGDYPSCYDPSRHVMDTNPEYGLKFISNVLDRLGLGDKWAYFDAHKNQWRGPVGTNVRKICKSADLVLNVSGANPLRSWLQGIPKRVLIDTDPVFTQVGHLSDESRRKQASKHTDFFTFAENFNTEICSVPEDGFMWKPTRQPVVLRLWPVRPAPMQGSFTTVMQWDSYECVVHDNVRYGMKSDSFRPYLQLPQKTDLKLEIAMGSENAPRNTLRENGWLLNDPLEITRDPWTYQAYIQASRGEFSVAKHGYVSSHSGWFSERSAAYLASGRPVIVEDTGFTDWMDVGSGVLAFNNPEEALEALNLIDDHYDIHCEAARSKAEEYFDSAKVLQGMLDHVLN